MPLIKTDAGRRAIKEGSPLLLQRQKSALIMFNGVKSTADVMTIVAGIGVTKADVDQLITHGFLVDTAPGPSPPAQTPAAVIASKPAAAPVAEGSAIQPEPARAASGLTTNQQRFATAWPLATQLTASLGLRGFRLNLSVESAAGYDDLLALFPKIQAAVGAAKSVGLERALKD